MGFEKFKVILTVDHIQLGISDGFNISAGWCLLYKTPKVGNKSVFGADPKGYFLTVSKIVHSKNPVLNVGHFPAGFARFTK
jgi:hypothetical protein